MSSPPIAIRAVGLRKAFRVYAHPADALIEVVTRRARHSERMALDDVNLEVLRGEIVGILGRNGAGKSTLLKIIAGTLERTSGKLDIHGRITAILELGTGFHPEYTGRENIYMGGLCLGMSRREIDQKVEQIIDFSELRSVIDQPFKTYSTGMQARLTFSTAISVEPDILIVDEALSVGDAKFQLKCFARLQALREQKTTILLVSHDTNTITSLCDRAIILENGRVAAEGDAKRISVLYHNMLFGLTKELNQTVPTMERPEANAGPISAVATVDTSAIGQIVRYGSGEGELTYWGLFDSNGNEVSVVESGEPFEFRFGLKANADIADLSCGFAIKDRRGTVLWGITNLTEQRRAFPLAKGQSLIVSAPSVMWLAAGDYFVTLGAAHVEDGQKIDFVEDGIGFRVLGPGNIFTTSVINLQTRLQIQLQPESDVQREFV
jgi:lipopolysaccharide transport system ATP-binding protein